MRSGANTYSHAGSVMNEKLFGAISTINQRNGSDLNNQINQARVRIIL